jgi:hypothetical protein
MAKVTERTIAKDARVSPNQACAVVADCDFSGFKPLISGAEL